jgi:hypothetical protein
MIYLQISDEDEKYLHGYFSDMEKFDIRFSPALLRCAKAYIKAYEHKHGSDLPIVDHFTDDASGD